MDLKYRIRITTSVDKKLYEAFRALSAKSRIPQSKLFDEAIGDLLVKHGDTLPEDGGD